MFLLLLFVAQLTQVQGLDCYQCIGIRNVSDCHNLVVCPADHLCSTESSGVGNQTLFNLTCKPKQDCTTTTTPPSTMTGSQNTDCFQCCGKAACNTYLCSAGTQTTSSGGPCKDDPTFNCPQISTLYNICGDVQHAKAVCRDFCSLCDLVDGGWAHWNSWSACDVSCNNGTMSRSRTCTNPSPAHGGLDCRGLNKQNSACHMPDCPISGGWSVWSPWGSCSVSCGVGLQRRDRSCSNPYPERFGAHCFGDDKVYRSCFDRSCSDGAWTTWSSWGTCSATCNGGLQSRTRHCTNPAPSRFGRACIGSDMDKQPCNSHNCPATDGAWTTWTSWGTCSATCNGGLQSRTRNCNNPSPSQFGRACIGNDMDKQTCNSHNCPERRVGFSVYNTKSALTSDSTATFYNTILNTGSYNMTTGKFTCPVAGLYSFSLTLRIDSSSTIQLYCVYRINGVDNSYVYTYQDAYGSASGTMNANLEVGDVVDLRCGNWDHVTRSYDTAFSGVLITPA